MDGAEWPAEMHSYNERFTKMIEAVKRRHDPVVTTVGECSGPQAIELYCRYGVAPEQQWVSVGEEKATKVPMAHLIPYGLFLPVGL